MNVVSLYVCSSQSISSVYSFTDEVKLTKLEETNPIEDNLDNSVAHAKFETKLSEDRRTKHETNRNKLKLKNSVEQKQMFECSDCNEVFTSSKM